LFGYREGGIMNGHELRVLRYRLMERFLRMLKAVDK
jgi:hypothetical protein